MPAWHVSIGVRALRPANVWKQGERRAAIRLARQTLSGVGEAYDRWDLLGLTLHLRRPVTAEELDAMPTGAAIDPAGLPGLPAWWWPRGVAYELRGRRVEGRHE